VVVEQIKQAYFILSFAGGGHTKIPCDCPPHMKGEALMGLATQFAEMPFFVTPDGLFYPDKLAAMSVIYEDIPKEPKKLAVVKNIRTGPKQLSLDLQEVPDQLELKFI